MDQNERDYIENVNHHFEILGKDIMNKFNQEGISKEDFLSYCIKRINEVKKANDIERRIFTGELK